MRLKFTSIIFFLILIVQTTQAQDTTPESSWKIGGDAGLTFFQSSFVNWTDGGGDPTTTIGFLGNIFAKYSKDRTSWSNIGLAQYQLQKIGKDADFLKSIDRLEILSVGGYQIKEDNDNFDVNVLDEDED